MDQNSISVCRALKSLRTTEIIHRKGVATMTMGSQLTQKLLIQFKYKMTVILVFYFNLFLG